MDKKCVVCGKMFKTKGKEITCSEECKLKRRRQTQRDFVIKHGKITEHTKTCVICGKTFSTYREKQITCSKECNYQNTRNNIKKHQIENKDIRNARRNEKYVSQQISRTFTCKVCNKEFVAEHKRSICSDECRKEQLKVNRNKNKIIGGFNNED